MPIADIAAWGITKMAAKWTELPLRDILMSRFFFKYPFNCVESIFCSKTWTLEYCNSGIKQEKLGFACSKHQLAANGLSRGQNYFLFIYFGLKALNGAWQIWCAFFIFLFQKDIEKQLHFRFVQFIPFHAGWEKHGALLILHTLLSMFWQLWRLWYTLS